MRIEIAVQLPAHFPSGENLTDEAMRNVMRPLGGGRETPDAEDSASQSEERDVAPTPCPVVVSSASARKPRTPKSSASPSPKRAAASSSLPGGASGQKLRMFAQPSPSKRKLFRVLPIPDDEEDEDDDRADRPWAGTPTRRESSITIKVKQHVESTAMREQAPRDRSSSSSHRHAGNHNAQSITTQSTTEQGYSSYRSGSLHAFFSKTPNFFDLTNAPSRIEPFVDFCRAQQGRAIRFRETEDSIARNRASLLSQTPQRRLRRSSGLSHLWTPPSSASSVAKPSLKGGIKRDYSRMLGTGSAGASKKKASKAKLVISEFRAFPVMEVPYAAVKSHPWYSAWIPLKAPISCADDPLLRYVCYFGEHDYEDVMADVYDVENVDTQGKNAHQERVAELYELDDAIIEQFLIRFALDRPLSAEELSDLEKALRRNPERSKVAVPTSGGARGPKDPTEPDAGESFEARCARLLKSLRRLMNLPASGSIAKAGPGSETELMDSFRSLFCRICFQYDCPLHGAPDMSEELAAKMWDIQRAWAAKPPRPGIAAPAPTTAKCTCPTGSLRSVGGIAEKDRVLCEKALVVCRRSACDAAVFLNGVATCGDLQALLREMKEETAPPAAEDVLAAADACQLDVIGTRRIKDLVGSKTFYSQFIKSLLNSETSKRLVQEAKQGLLRQSANVPCYHLGPCSAANGCSCAVAGSFCTKHCMCSVYLPAANQALCKNFYPGCRCTAGCETKNCPCHSTSTACDPDLCLSCGCPSHKRYSSSASTTCTSTLPPKEHAHRIHHHHKQDHHHPSTGSLQVDSEESDDEVAPTFKSSSTAAVQVPTASTTTNAVAVEKKFCQNRLHDLAHLLLAESEVEGAGWGIFARTAIAQGQMVAEYLGEFVSQEEAERRGRYYDKVNRSYLFNVNADQVVDAFRKGNKIKFANHSKKPNCEVKIITVERQQHIVFFAKRDIEAGEELFFDYHYEQEQNSAYVKKNGVVVDWMRNGKRANSIRKRPLDAQLIKKSPDATAAEEAPSKKRKKT